MFVATLIILIILIMNARNGSSKRQCTFNSLRHSAFDHIRNHFPANAHSLDHSLEDWLQSADLTKPGDLNNTIPSPDDPLSRHTRNIQSHRVVPSHKRRPFQPVEPNRASLRPKRKMADKGDNKNTENPSKRVTRSQQHALAMGGGLGGTGAQGQNKRPAVKMTQLGDKKLQQQLNERVGRQKSTQTQAKDVLTGLGLDTKTTALPPRRLLDDNEQAEGERSFGQAQEMTHIPILLPTRGQMNCGAHSSSPRGGSPSRKSAGRITQDKSISMDSTTTGSSSPSKRAVDKRTYMKYLDPPTTFVTPTQWKINEAPKPVKCLWREYIRREDAGQGIGIIPRELQVCICFHNILNAYSQSAFLYLGSNKVIYRHAEQANPRCS